MAELFHFEKWTKSAVVEYFPTAKLFHFEVRRSTADGGVSSFCKFYRRTAKLVHFATAELVPAELIPVSGEVYYELLEPSKTIAGDRYQQQLASASK